MADRRFIDAEGTEWASRYESEVYHELRRVLGDRVRKCEQGEGDSLPYTTPVRGGRCLECNGGQVVQCRSYTPDLFIDTSQSGDGTDGYFVEVKGFWDAAKRNLLRNVCRSNPDFTLLFVFFRDNWVTKGKSKYTDYVKKYFKNSGAVVWNNKVKKPADLAHLMARAYNELKES